MLANILYAAVMVSLTTFAGLSLTPKRISRVTRLVLAYALGFTVISLVGLCATVLDTNVFVMQLLALILLVGYSLRRVRKPARITIEEKTVLLVFVMYLSLFLFLFSNIPTWMAGDTLQRAIEIQMFMDEKDIPVSVFPFGSYWAQYPKAFQAYTFFWVKLLRIQITEALKVIPILLSVYAPLGLYAIVREYDAGKLALYAVAIACFGFIPHTAMLVWGGFTTLAGEMMLAAVILAFIVDKKLVPLFLAGLLFSHPRVFFFTVLIVGTWQSLKLMKKSKLAGTVIVVLLAIMVLTVGARLYDVSFSLKAPIETKEIIEEKTINPIFSVTWIFGLLAAIGFIYAIKMKNPLDILVISWILSLSMLAFIVDTGIISRHRMSIDRILTELYLPLSVLSAYVFFFIQEKLKGRVKNVHVVLLLLILASGTWTSHEFIKEYYEPWSLPEPDYNAFNWLRNQAYDNAVLVNLDSTGMWAYPIAGIELVDPFMFTYRPPQYILDIAHQPGQNDAFIKLDGLKMNHSRVLIYISNVSSTHGDYKPPFARFYGFYLNPKTSEFSNEDYGTVYDREGVFIFEYVRGGERR